MKTVINLLVVLLLTACGNSKQQKYQQEQKLNKEYKLFVVYTDGSRDTITYTGREPYLTQRGCIDTYSNRNSTLACGVSYFTQIKP